MANGNWGHCQHCKYFGSPARAPLVNEEANCRQQDLARHHLVVFGASGCTLFELRPGVPVTAEDPPYVVTGP
jgi:hypothetical protein